ncbi:MAG: hypothetical protein JWO20_1596 [Candidatus Angelobacter sp.]|nr:hypothetical protein [Candidatus Angelobacter sp.]
MNRKTTTFEKALRARLTAMAASATFALLLAGYAPPGFAQSPAPQNFSSPEKASRALVAAVKADDDEAMMKILGAGKALVTLEDQAQNKQEREQFVNKYNEMHRLVLEPDRTTVLYIGAENWPFPVPLVSSNGTWHFDARTGMREVLYRRIGENETKAIETCHALAETKREEQSSQEGGAGGNSLSALLTASNDGSAKLQDKPVQSDGYYFRVLRGANKNAHDAGDTGVSFIAYPVEYRESGVMTFIVSGDDVVYQKDLGPNTGKLGKTMTTYQPGSTWRKAE